VQELAMSVRPEAMTFDPSAMISADERTEWTERARGMGAAVPAMGEVATRLEFAIRLAQAGHA
jgi:hypothetical protein